MSRQIQKSYPSFSHLEHPNRDIRAVTMRERQWRNAKYARSLTVAVRMLSLFLLFFQPTSHAAQSQILAPGITYYDLMTNPLTPWAHVHAFRINPKSYPLSLARAKDFSQQQASIDELAHKSHALIAINGGFFDRQFRPLGLRIHQRREQNPVKRISWWGILLIKNNIPSLISAKDYQPDANIQFAIQSGPRLIIDGHIPHLKPGIAERSAIGITNDQQLVILVTDNAMLTTTELASLMKAPPLNCENALNLDGGSSSQLFAHIRSFHLDVHGFANVSDAIVVK